MTPLQLELIKLIGKKESRGEKFEIIENGIQRVPYETINHPATLSDLHRWIKEQVDNSENRIFAFSHLGEQIMISYIGWRAKTQPVKQIPYDSSKDLLDQETSTLEKVISLITSNQ